MSWVSKTVKKVGHWVDKHKNEILGVMTAGASVPFTTMYDNIQDQKELAKEALREQERANAEAEAIARARGVTATADNAGELGYLDAETRRKRGYLGSLKSQKDGSNTLLAAAASYGNKRTLGA